MSLTALRALATGLAIALSAGLPAALPQLTLPAASPQLTLPQSPPPPATPQIVIGATVAQRQEAARSLVPLLKKVQAHAQPGTAVAPGSASPSPFTGAQSTLFAFTISKRAVPVEPRVLAAMNRLLDWNVGASGHDEEAQLFDRWLMELESRSSAAARLSGGGVCDVSCIVGRMTTLDDAWGRDPRGRDDARDELLLDALKAAVARP